MMQVLDGCRDRLSVQLLIKEVMQIDDGSQPTLAKESLVKAFTKLLRTLPKASSNSHTSRFPSSSCICCQKSAAKVLLRLLLKSSLMSGLHDFALQIS